MTADLFQKSVEAMEILKARELLSKIDVASFTNLKEQSRQKFHKQVSKRAFPNHFDNWVSSDEAVKILKQRGF